jgi:hypothetical protein
VTLRPPARAAAWLLEDILPPGIREPVLGDLAEEYWLRLQSQPRAAAARWYRTQVLRSLLNLSGAALLSGRWLSTAAIAVAVYIGVRLVQNAAGYLLSATLGLGPAGMMGAYLLIGLSTLFLGGYIAARIKPSAAPALAVAQALMVIAYIVTSEDAAALWIGMIFLVLCPAAALAGGMFCVRRSKRSGRPAA